ncbi:hypothetical protein ACFYIM_07690, partial [Streptococcus pyogenes]|uniref:hypothetical protein n=1 Tax=Streptococcus pyogenes TaxID=1314 RepID=UPI0035A5AD0A
MSNVWGVVQGFFSFLLHFILQRGQIKKYKKVKKELTMTVKISYTNKAVREVAVTHLLKKDEKVV